ncbi:MAG: phosphotransferase [Thermoleophilia bacterium]|nr:phosphotransferase [Thermoleophilia bacterium]
MSLGIVEDGWDSVVVEVGGEWIVRVPRRPEVRRALAVEVRLLPELPGPVPRFALVSEGAVAYRKLPGDPIDPSSRRVGAQVGGFLAELHAFPVERARELGVPEPPWRETYERFTREVLGAAELGPVAQAVVEGFLGDDANFAWEPALVHADLGPAHLLAEGDELTGVIDWGDVRIGDPALDFAWLLRQPFAEAVLSAYGAHDPGVPGRALFYHRLGPWYELHYGLFFDRPEFVESGLAGVRSRLPRALP